MTRTRIVWLALGFVYAAFAGWYTSCGGPLTPAEIDRYVERMRERGTDAEKLEHLRRFLASDTGDDFVMVNLIELREPPLAVGDVAPGESAEQVLGRYMAHMWPALLSRACHPVLMGQAAAGALDLWGVEDARSWSTAGMMRYRSRRDLMEIATDPDFEGPHEYKIAAMSKTIAFPADPWLQLGDPRLVLGLLLACFGLAIARPVSRPPTDRHGA